MNTLTNKKCFHSWDRAINSKNEVKQKENVILLKKNNTLTDLKKYIWVYEKVNC